jgi:hypothetical protein
LQCIENAAAMKKQTLDPSETLTGPDFEPIWGLKNI